MMLLWGFEDSVRQLSLLAWAAITKYHGLGDLNNKYLFPVVLEVEKSEIGCHGVGCTLRLLLVCR